MIISLNNKNNIKTIGKSANKIIELNRQNFNTPKGIVLDYLEIKKIFSKHIEDIKKTYKNLNENNIEESIQKIKTYIKATEKNNFETIENYLEENKTYCIRLSCENEKVILRTLHQQHVYFNITKNNIFNKIKEICLNLTTEETYKYFINKNISFEDLQIALIIQDIVPNKISGICFTVNPLNGIDTEMLVEYTAEEKNINDGADVSYSYTYDWKEEYLTNKKEDMKIPIDTIIKVNNICLNIQKSFGYPCNIDFGIMENNEICIYNVKKIKNVFYPSKYIMTNALTREAGFSDLSKNVLLKSIIIDTISNTMKYFMEYIKLKTNNVYEKELLVETYYGNIYWNVSYLHNILSSFPIISIDEFNKNIVGKEIRYKNNSKFKRINLLKMFYAWYSYPYFKKDVFNKNHILKGYNKLFSIYKNLDFEHYEIDVLEKMFMSIVEDYFVENEKTYLLQEYAYMIDFTYSNNIVSKYLNKEDYLNVLSDIGGIASLQPMTYLEKVKEKLKENNDIYYYWKIRDVDIILKDYNENKNKECFKVFNQYLEEFEYYTNNPFNFNYPNYGDNIKEQIQLLKSIILTEGKSKEEKTYPVILVSLKKNIPYNKYKKLIKITDNLRKNIAQQEQLKAETLKVIYILKKVTIALEKKYKEFGYIKEKSSIMFLEYNDIVKFIKNKDANILRKDIEKNEIYYNSFKNYRPQEELYNPKKVSVEKINKEISAEEMKDISITYHSKFYSCVGNGYSNYQKTGRAIIIKNESDYKKIKSGDIIFANSLNPTFIDLVPFLGGIVIKQGSVLCQTAIICRERHIPFICDIEYNGQINTGDAVTINGKTGEITKDNNGIVQ